MVNDTNTKATDNQHIHDDNDDPHNNETIGTVRMVTAMFASPLMWIFDDPSNKGWNEPSHGMVGNGFGWGQSSHLLGWVFHVLGAERLIPRTVHCVMTHSAKTGADICHAAIITCTHNGGSLRRNIDGTTGNSSAPPVILSLSGTCLLPGCEHGEGDDTVGKQIQISIFGTDGSIQYAGDDSDPTSGSLEVRLSSRHGKLGSNQSSPDTGFHFENTDTDGTGPESLQSFIDACNGLEYYKGAGSLLGLRTVQVLDAMYRSSVSGQTEKVLYQEDN